MNMKQVKKVNKNASLAVSVLISHFTDMLTYAFSCMIGSLRNAGAESFAIMIGEIASKCFQEPFL